MRLFGFGKKDKKLKEPDETSEHPFVPQSPHLIRSEHSFVPPQSPHHLIRQPSASRSSASGSMPASESMPRTLQCPPRKVPLLKRLLQGTSTVAMVTVPGIAVAQQPAVSTSTTYPLPLFTETKVQQLVNEAFSETKVQQLVNEAIAAHPVETTAVEKSEFRHLTHEAAEKIREKSAEFAKDIAKLVEHIGEDLVKDAVELYMLKRVAPFFVATLRQWPKNPYVKTTADRLDKLLAQKAEPTSEANVISATGCTHAQAQSTLHLAGYQLHGGLWLPLGMGGERNTHPDGSA